MLIPLFKKIEKLIWPNRARTGTDVAVGTIKLVTGLSKFKQLHFLKTLDVFMTLFSGTHKKDTPAKKVTLREAKENVDKVCSEVQRRVASVKERFNLSRETNVQRVQFPRISNILSPCYVNE